MGEEKNVVSAEGEDVLSGQFDAGADDFPKVTARGPDAPTVRENKKRGGRKKHVDGNLGAEVPGVIVRDETVPREQLVSNPRLGNNDEGQMSRRREEIWQTRDKKGRGCRRELYDVNGNPNGGSTSI